MFSFECLALSMKMVLKYPPPNRKFPPLLRVIPLPLKTILKTLLDISSKVSLYIFSSILNCNLANQKNPAIKA